MGSQTSVWLFKAACPTPWVLRWDPKMIHAHWRTQNSAGSDTNTRNTDTNVLQNTDADGRRRAPNFAEILLYVNRPSDLSVPQFHLYIFVFCIFACVSVSSGRCLCWLFCAPPSFCLVSFTDGSCPQLRVLPLDLSLSSPVSFSLSPSTPQKINRYRYICLLECWLISTHFNGILLPLPGPTYRSQRPSCACGKPDIESLNGYPPRIPLF